MEPQTEEQPTQAPPTSDMEPLQPEMEPSETVAPEPQFTTGSSNLIWLLVFIILSGGIGLFLWWVWLKSPLVGWLKVVLTIIPFAILAALI